MAITTLDGLIAGFLPFGNPFLGVCTPQAVGGFTSMWALQGIPGPGANSSSGVAGDIPTDATAGAFPFTNVSNTHLARVGMWATQPGQLLLYDRLWQQSGLSPTTIGNQTVQAASPAVPLTRPDANGERAEAWIQVFGVLGSGATAPTITYTDQTGNTPNTGTAVGWVTTAAANRTFQFSLAAGDTGVRSIQFYDNIGSHTSGTFGLILRRYIHALTQPVANISASDGPIECGLPRIYDDACIELLWISNSTAAQSVGGNFSLAQG